MKKLLVDYHFHPNFWGPSWAQRKRAQLIWREFAKQKMDVVFITEHVYKNPQRSFHLLQATKPKDAATRIFPGMEAVTAEGIDIMVFAEHAEELYMHKQLFTPKAFGLFDMIAYINAHPQIYGSIAHPYCVGKSGVIKKVGEEKALQAIKAMGGVEVHNLCFRGPNKIADFTRLGKIFKKTREWAGKTTELPEEFYNLPTMKRYTGGSDAHVIVEIGTGLLVPVPEAATTDAEIFQAIMNNNTHREYVEVKNRLYFWRGLYKMYSVFDESAKRERWLKTGEQQQ